MESKQHLAVFITWFIGLTIIIALLILTFSSWPVPQPMTQETILLSLLEAIPWGFLVAVVTYPCAYCYMKDMS